jgi:hypothetical protein
MTEDLRIVEIATDKVGSPRNDGSCGSGLYAVPVRLSRRPTAREAQLLKHYWDHPPQFSTMHRPGIARAEGDLLVLDGTTIDEVERYHALTLRLVVAEANREEARQTAADEARKRQDEEATAAHRRHVGETARRIRFDS